MANMPSRSTPPLPGAKPPEQRKSLSASTLCAFFVACVLIYLGVNLNSVWGTDESLLSGTTLVFGSSDINALSDSRKLDIMRKVVGDVQEQIKYTLHNGQFNIVPGEPKEKWEDKNMLPGPAGHADWLHGDKVVWAPMPLLKKEEQVGAKVPFDLSDDAMLKCMTGRRIFVAGSSYQRELYYVLARLLKHNTFLDEKFTMIPSIPVKLGYDKDCKRGRFRKTGTAADGRKFCYLIQKVCSNLIAGVKIDECGMPGNSSYFSEEHDAKIMYQFKTFMDTPEVDRHIRDKISEYTWDSLMLGGGEWGRASQELNEPGPASKINPLLAPPHQDLSVRDEHSVQASRYLSVLFPQIEHSGAIILAYCGPGVSRSCRQWCEVSKRAQKQFLVGKSAVPVLLFEAVDLMAKSYGKVRTELGLPAAGHGNAGPIVDQYTRLMMAARCRVSEQASKLEAEALVQEAAAAAPSNK